MSTYRKLAVATFVVICLAMISPKIQAQLLDEKVRVTFSAPVEIPGGVLPAGAYVFEAIEPNLTRIFSADGTVYGTVFTVPQEREQPVEKATIVLGENTLGGPERVEAWFYPGDSVGSEFTYTEPSSHHKGTSALSAAYKGIGVAVRDTAKGALDSSEFVGRHAERVVVNSAASIGHAAKYLVS